MLRFKKILTILSLVLWPLAIYAQTRHWQTADGLPTGEVRQIISLPNRQMLINCEGVFCISDGKGFIPVPCDRRKTYQLDRYTEEGYAQLWQGDSLLWLRDFYRVYLFDMRTRSFRYDITDRLSSLPPFIPSPPTVNDWQGGTWTCSMGNGILYTPPAKGVVQIAGRTDSLVYMARKAAELSLPVNDSCLLQCRGLNQLYYHSNDGRSVSLNDKLPQLNSYRYIVGACRLTGTWIVLYTQNGACMLDTRADTLAPFPPSDLIEEYTDKYNCMVLGADNRLWIGTQNGLFVYDGKNTVHIEGLANNCIRSMVSDASGDIWAGTSSGISKITPAIVNYGEDDAMPQVAMMERAACCTADGRLVFVHHNADATVFRPEWLADTVSAPIPVFTRILINGHERMVPHDEKIVLPHYENYLTFQFSSLDYAHPSHTNYRYRLSGLETDWHKAAQERGRCVAEYKALPPGKYLFEAQTASVDGKWSDALLLSFTIRPPLWLTWWAKALYALLCFAALVALLTIYIRKKKKALERDNDNRVNQLFERREEARHQFAENTQIDPKKIGINDEEKLLTEQLLAAVEAHIDDEEYSVDQLARDVALSRTALYAKLRTMLGISPADFMRNVRLKRAAQMLADTSLPINEVATRVGFATARNFSSSFKKMFGVLPSEYRGTDSGSAKS